MSPISGYLTPQARATIEAVFAKLAAPGMCNPDQPTPCLDGTPAPEAVTSDTRSTAQRNHDALTAAGRALLASGDLGQHNGLPASIIVSTTLQELEAGAGKGLTGGGTLLPMSDVIRLASHAHHYLAIFDKGKALALYHTKRLASPAQRIVLYAKDRGCSRPACDVPGYFTEVHHCTPYAKCRTTDVNDLTLACGGDHPLNEQGWTTRKNAHGETEWIPPPHLDRGQPRVNRFHHPEKLLRDGERRRRRSVVALRAVALGVVEESPVAVDVDFHAPAEFGVVGLRVDEPGVRVVGAGDLLGVDDVAVRIDHSVGRHTREFPAAGKANRAIPR